MAWRPTQLALTWRKSLYLEWYSNANGRVVFQSTCLDVERIGERQFELTEQEWCEQANQNAEQMDCFMTQLDDALDSCGPDEDDES